MIEQTITIINKLGLHARAAAKLVNTASQFESQIHISKGARQADAKSIMSIMMLAATQGTEIVCTLEGSDEIEAWQQVSALINNRFDEDE
ncbi:HPr family phosphocarrier protein [Reinekea thalattae]|uniref:HPr family phosphocarrier protein n=1 Tax=Reinekea thalattae TaxID=2593301 RepID=A0A5C8Z257_9GAMM|nr:HPr family phosphocarrier protein [Reinekea thalattae]TXR52165.1 HPr family phosphocarrier protein [Reinekea thalattae]